MVQAARKLVIAPFRSRGWVAYGIALFGVIGATVIRWLLHPYLDDYISFGFYYLAVTLAAWTGGIFPALFAAVLGALFADYFFTPTMAIDSPQELLNIILFGVVSVVIGVLSETSLRALARAKEAEALKDNFLATLAHELRSPLTVIQYANQLERRATGNADSDRSAIIDRQVEHLSQLVSDLLDISRVARGKIHLDLKEVDAADVLHGALEKVRPLIDARRHVLHVHVPPAPLPLLADRLRLEQVLLNLLTNAAKYTPENGEIEAAVFEQDGQAIVSVRDNGLGIPREMLGQVFELFTQVETTGGSDAGLGIGLSLVRKLVEMHGGTVTAHSAGPGKGSEFVVELPLAEKRTPQRSEPMTAAS